LNGNAGCFGSNALTPTDPNFFQNVISIAGGIIHTCVLKSDSSVACLLLGNPTLQTPDGGQAIVPSNCQTGISSIYAGLLHTCALSTTNSLCCWGANVYVFSSGSGGTSNQSTVPSN